MINPIMISFQENIKTKMFHLQNKNYLFSNVVFIFPSNLLGDSKPCISYAETFYPMLNELNTCLLDWNLVSVDQVFETMTLFWRSVVNEFKILLTEEKIVQLRDDLKLKHPYSVADIITLEDVHD